MKLNRIDSQGMLGVYALQALLGVAYMYVTWRSDYSLGDGMGFQLYYSFSCGALLVVGALLIRCALSSRGILKTRLLLKINIGFQAMDIAVDIVFACMYGGFWDDGYVFLIIEALLAVIFLRRLFFLNQLERLISDDVTDSETFILKDQEDRSDESGMSGIRTKYILVDGLRAGGAAI
jgi:hypothetical protein